MPAERLSMRQIREVLRLCFESRLPQRAVARSLGLSQGAVSGYLSRARAAGVAWPLPEDLDEARLEALLFPPPSGTPADQRPMPDWGWVHRELRRPDVTLALLWEEYRAGAADGFGYSWFCDLYRAWAGRLKLTMRQIHLAGERMFVDFAGRTAEVVDATTGEIVPVQIFVAVLGASSFTYAEAGGRHHQGVVLRAGGQPDLCRHGAALPHRHRSGAALQAARQDTMRIGCGDRFVF